MAARKGSARKHMCSFHEVEHSVDGFYFYPKSETSPERWICKAKESDRQKLKHAAKKAEKAGGEEVDGEAIRRRKRKSAARKRVLAAA